MDDLCCRRDLSCLFQCLLRLLRLHRDIRRQAGHELADGCFLEVNGQRLNVQDQPDHARLEIASVQDLMRQGNGHLALRLDRKMPIARNLVGDNERLKIAVHDVHHPGPLSDRRPSPEDRCQVQDRQ